MDVIIATFRAKLALTPGLLTILFLLYPSQSKKALVEVSWGFCATKWVAKTTEVPTVLEASNLDGGWPGWLPVKAAGRI